MLSDKAPQKRSVRSRSVNAKNKHWSDRQKIEAAQTYLLLGGNATITASTLKIPLITLNYWRGQEWWKELLSDIKTQEHLTLSVKLKNLIDKSLTLVEDRLDKGDFIYDQKTGQMKRKPVVLRDVHKVAADLLDRKSKLDLVQVVQTSQESIEERLKKLADSFKTLADNNGKQSKIEVTDVIFGKEVNEAG